MTRLAAILLAFLSVSAIQEPEIRWIHSDTREYAGTVTSSNEKMVEIKVAADTGMSLSPLKAIVYYGPTIAEEVRIMSFEITYIRPEMDTITQMVRGAYFPANMMALMKSAKPGDSFHVSKLRVEGPSAMPLLLKRNYLFRITY